MADKLFSIEDLARSIPGLPAQGPARLTALRAAAGSGPAPAALGVRPRRLRHALPPAATRLAEIATLSSASLDNLSRNVTAPNTPDPDIATPPVAETPVHALPPLTEEEAAAIPTEARYFDRDWYVRTYPDVAQSGIDPVRHFRECGEAEGRNPNPHFNARLYLAANPDAAHGALSPFGHFIMYGISERRRLRPDM